MVIYWLAFSLMSLVTAIVYIITESILLAAVLIPIFNLSIFLYMEYGGTLRKTRRS